MTATLFPLSRFGGMGRRVPALPDLVGDGLLDVLDRHRVGVDGQDAGVLARRRAQPPGELGEVVRGVQPLRRGPPVAVRRVHVPLGDEIPQRTPVVAERYAAVHTAPRLLGHDRKQRLPRVDLAPVAQPFLHRARRHGATRALEKAMRIGHAPPPSLTGAAVRRSDQQVVLITRRSDQTTTALWQLFRFFLSVGQSLHRIRENSTPQGPPPPHRPPPLPQPKAKILHPLPHPFLALPTRSPSPSPGHGAARTHPHCTAHRTTVTTALPPAYGSSGHDGHGLARPLRDTRSRRIRERRTACGRRPGSTRQAAEALSAARRPVDQTEYPRRAKPLPKLSRAPLEALPKEGLRVGSGGRRAGHGEFTFPTEPRTPPAHSTNPDTAQRPTPPGAGHGIGSR